MTPPRKILIACGGTGGHLFPGIAIAQELQARGHEPLLLISEKKIDSTAASKYKNFPFISVPAIAKPPLLSLRSPQFFWNMFSTYMMSRKIIRNEQIDIIIGMGGFTSLPPVLAGKHMGKPCYIHDSNAMPGKANRLTSRFCDKVFIGMKAAAAYFGKKKCIFVGTPVREEIRQCKSSREQSRKKLQLDIPENQALILVIGGSQGAKQLNSLIIEAARQDTRAHYLIITGPLDQPRVSKLAAGAGNIHIITFCSEMAHAYKAADGVIARAGASTLTELSQCGKASLLIPFPFAADDHQTHNSENYSKQNAALLIQQAQLSSEDILHFVHEVILKPEKRQAMEEAIKSLDHPKAASDIADILLQA